MKYSRIQVSVIMPAYNAGRRIDEAIRSVLAQKGVSFELLICDDGSSDDTWSRMVKYRPDPRVRLFRFRSNRGVAAARNRLIGRARGFYLSVCDADDRLLPGNLAIFSRILRRNRAVGVIYGDRLIKQGGSVRITSRFEYGKAWDILGGRFPGGGAMMRLSAIKKIGGYRTRFRYLEDGDLLIRLSEVTRIHYFKGRPLYFQNRSRGSLSDQSRKNLLQASKILLRDAIQRRYGIHVRW